MPSFPTRLPPDFLAGRLRGAVPRRSRRLPFIAAYDSSRIAISELDWERIENAYGVTLLPAVKEGVLNATRAFIDLDRYERTAPPIADAKQLILRWDRSAESFQKALMTKTGFADA